MVKLFPDDKEIGFWPVPQPFPFSDAHYTYLFNTRNNLIPKSTSI